MSIAQALDATPADPLSLAVEWPSTALRYRAALTAEPRPNHVRDRGCPSDQRRRRPPSHGRRFGTAEPGFEQVRHAAGRLRGVWLIMPGAEAGRRQIASKISARDRPSQSPAVTASSTAAWRASISGSRCRHGKTSRPASNGPSTAAISGRSRSSDPPPVAHQPGELCFELTADHGHGAETGQKLVGPGASLKTQGAWACAGTGSRRGCWSPLSRASGTARSRVRNRCEGRCRNGASPDTTNSVPRRSPSR